MARKKLINKIEKLICDNHITKDTDLTKLDIWLSDSFDEFLLKSINIEKNELIAIDDEVYYFNEFSIKELLYLKDKLSFLAETNKF